METEMIDFKKSDLSPKTHSVISISDDDENPVNELISKVDKDEFSTDTVTESQNRFSNESTLKTLLCGIMDSHENLKSEPTDILEQIKSNNNGFHSSVDENLKKFQMSHDLALISLNQQYSHKRDFMKIKFNTSISHIFSSTSRNRSISPLDVDSTINTETEDLLSFLGLEDVVMQLTNHSHTPIEQKSTDKKPLVIPLKCVQCNTEFKPMWKKERPTNGPGFICECCIKANYKTKVKLEGYDEKMKDVCNDYLDQEDKMLRDYQAVLDSREKFEIYRQQQQDQVYKRQYHSSHNRNIAAVRSANGRSRLSLASTLPSTMTEIKSATLKACKLTVPQHYGTQPIHQGNDHIALVEMFRPSNKSPIVLNRVDTVDSEEIRQQNELRAKMIQQQNKQTLATILQTSLLSKPKLEKTSENIMQRQKTPEPLPSTKKTTADRKKRKIFVELDNTEPGQTKRITRSSTIRTREV